jgi:ATP-binding cassette subfamily C protein CydD
MSAPPAPSDDELKAWLAGRTRDAGVWPTLAWLAGLVATVALVVQAFVLAAFFQGWVFDHQSFSSLAGWWLALPFVVALRALAGWAKEEAGLRASRLVRHKLRADLVDHVGALGPAWKAGQTSGALSSQLLEQVDGLDAYVARYLAQQKLSALAPALILLVVFPLNWVCGLLLLLTAPLIPLFMILIGTGAQAVQTKQLRSLSRMSGHFLDLLRGLTTLKLLDAHRRQGDTVARVAEGFRVRTMEVLRLAFLSSTMLEFFSVLAIALTALYLGFTLLGEINFGLAVSFQTALFVLLLAPDFYQPLRDLGVLYHARAEALACAAQLKPILDAVSPSPAGGTTAPAPGAPALSVTDLHFAHVAGVPVLSGLNLEVGAGEAVAVTGPSGVGKTTLLRILQGELKAGSGDVRVNGTRLEQLDLELWRSRTGWMSQHPRLLASTLRDNLRVARQSAGDGELVHALEFAGLRPWYEGLEEGLSTRLGEGGRTVSGGQLRRIALARLSLRDATLLLLDEPTASLDEKTQDLVLARLAELRKGKTVVLLTHHPKPLALADRVVALAGAEGEPE